MAHLGTTECDYFRHFKGHLDTDIVSVYPVCPDPGGGSCNFGVLDIDHDGTEANRRAAWRMACTLCDRLCDLGLWWMLEDSGGGYHLWIRFAGAELRVADLATLLRLVRGGYEDVLDIDGQKILVELFPDNPVCEGYGKAIRLPGRRPGTDFWSGIWAGDRFVVGAEATGWILNYWYANDSARFPVLFDQGRQFEWFDPSLLSSRIRRAEHPAIDPGTTPTDSRIRAYLDAMVAGVCSDVAGAVSNRNNLLTEKALWIGNFLHYDYPELLRPDRAYERLWEAAAESGLALDEPDKTADTIRRNLEDGATRPELVHDPDPERERPPAGAGSSAGPLEADRERAGPPVFRNSTPVAVGPDAEGRVKYVRQPRTQGELVESFFEQTDGWPKWVEEVGLFSHRPGSKIAFEKLSKEEDLRSWAGDRFRIEFPSSPTGVISWRTFFCTVQRHAERFDAIANEPYFLLDPRYRIYYTCPEVAPDGDGTTLERLLDFFRPETSEDRDLIRALIMTMLWGGPGGTRPVFLIEADEEDAEGGRGSGKTIMVQRLSELVGGAYEGFSINDSVEATRQRLLNDKDNKRVAVFDNVKTSRFSSGDLEGLVTAGTVGGHKLYVGDGSRPNLITYMATINAAAMSSDLATRTVLIRIRRPTEDDPGSRTWDKDLRAFIEENRDAIYRDVAAIFAREAKDFNVGVFRWREWSCDVLGRCPDPDRLLALIRSRQSALNADRNEADGFIEHIREECNLQGLDGPTPSVFISSNDFRALVETFWNERVALKGLPAFLKQRQLSPRIQRDRNARERGYLLVGDPGGARISYQPRLDDNRRPIR